MGVISGASVPNADRIKHYYDPRNNKSNIKVGTPAATTTTFNDMIGSNDVTVTDTAMLHTDGYIDFPVPDMTNVALRGCEFHGEFAEQDATNADDGIYLDFHTQDGCTFSFWVYLSETLSHSNPYGTALEHVIFGPYWTGDNFYHNQFSIDSGTTANPAGRPSTNKNIEIRYNLLINRSILPKWMRPTYTESVTSGDQTAENQMGEKLLPRGQWSHVVIAGNQPNSNSTLINHDVWFNGEKIISDITVDSAGHSTRQNTITLNSIGCQEDKGAGTRPPGLSLQGRLGPFIHWDKKLTDNEIRSLYNSMKPNV